MDAEGNVVKMLLWTDSLPFLKQRCNVTQQSFNITHIL